MGKVYQKVKMLATESILRQLDSHLSCTHVVLGQFLWAGWYMHPCYLQVKPWSHPWRLGVFAFSLAATSALITFLLDCCISLLGLPAAYPWPLPTLPQRALSSLRIVNLPSSFERWHPIFRTGPIAPPGPALAPASPASALGTTSVSSSVSACCWENPLKGHPPCPWPLLLLPRQNCSPILCHWGST